MKYGEDVTPVDTTTEAANKMLNAHGAGRMVVACCTCSVVYDGTVKMTLPKDTRTVILKPDGALLIHSATGVEPTNWQKSKSKIKMDIEDGRLVITAEKSSDKLTVVCSDIHKSIHYAPPSEDESPDIRGTEQDMHAAIMASPELIEEDFIAIENEKEIRTGSIDIYGMDSMETPVVIEVKRRKAQLQHVDQLNRYCETLQETHGVIRGILVAPDVSTSAAAALEEKELEFIELDPLDII